MNGRITLRPEFFLDTDSEDARIGAEIAKEAIARAANHSPAIATVAFVEEILALLYAEPTTAPTVLYGVMHQMLSTLVQGTQP